MLTFTYFLFKHLVGVSSVGERLPMVLELIEKEAEPVLKHIHVHNDKLRPQMCVLHGCLEFSLSAFQLLSRFPRNQFLRAVVADAIALKSCKD